MSAQIIPFPTREPEISLVPLGDATWHRGFGTRLTELRKLLGLSKPKMAAVFGVHPVTYHLWEGGYKGRKVHRGLARLSCEHRVSLKWLLAGEGEPFQQSA